ACVIRPELRLELVISSAGRDLPCPGTARLEVVISTAGRDLVVRECPSSGSAGFRAADRRSLALLGMTSGMHVGPLRKRTTLHRSALRRTAVPAVSFRSARRR